MKKKSIMLMFCVLSMLALSVFFSSCSDDSFSHTLDPARLVEYRESIFKVSGDDKLKAGQEYKYQVPSFEGAKYEWTTPNSVDITGEGSNEIKVNFKAHSDKFKLSVKMTLDGKEYNAEKEVIVEKNEFLFEYDLLGGRVKKGDTVYIYALSPFDDDDLETKPSVKLAGGGTALATAIQATKKMTAADTAYSIILPRLSSNNKFTEADTTMADDYRDLKRAYLTIYEIGDGDGALNLLIEDASLSVSKYGDGSTMEKILKKNALTVDNTAPKSSAQKLFVTEDSKSINGSYIPAGSNISFEQKTSENVKLDSASIMVVSDGTTSDTVKLSEFPYSKTWTYNTKLKFRGGQVTVSVDMQAEDEARNKASFTYSGSFYLDTVTPVAMVEQTFAEKSGDSIKFDITKLTVSDRYADETPTTDLTGSLGGKSVHVIVFRGDLIPSTTPSIEDFASNPQAYTYVQYDKASLSTESIKITGFENDQFKVFVCIVDRAGNPTKVTGITLQ